MGNVICKDLHGQDLLNAADLNGSEPNCRVRFITDPFTGELGTQTKMRFSANPKWDYWGWTYDIRSMAHRSTARPRVYTILIA